MKPSMIGGVVLVAIGIFVLMTSPSMTTRHDVLRVGDLKVSADERQSLPTWLGGVLIAGGAVVIALGLRGRRSA